MQIYNTQSRKKEELKPLHDHQVRIYACGPTVYNFMHIGNARMLLVFDTLRRYLKWRGYDVLYVQNFTDIDDKMIKGAAENGITVKELADKYIAEYMIDAASMNVLPADVHPKATEHIPEILEIIRKLVDKGLAYPTSDGVYYNTRAFHEYGKLSGQNLDDLEAGARIDVNEEKRDPMDFALWKKQKPGEPAWDSPWGAGRPGWHIECSAMSMKYLGETFDIHAGGQDLIFPHHENEIAQSEGATGHPFVNMWMHNGFVNINNEKMSKSKGNFFTVREIGKEFDLLAVRLFMLSSHYRSPINFSRDLVEQAQNALGRLRNARENAEFLLANQGTEDRAPNDAETAFGKTMEEDKARFVEQMEDDFNTAGGVGILFEYVRDMNSMVQTGVCKKTVQDALQMLKELSDVLGIWEEKKASEDDAVMALALERQAARKAKNFARADELRDQIKAMGYILEDTPQGPRVKKA